MARVPDIDSTPMEDAQRAVFNQIAAGPRGGVEGPLRIWLHSPALAEYSQQLGAFCRYGSSLPPRLSELAIVVIGAHWRAGFEWYIHAPIAAQVGISVDALEAIRVRREPLFSAADESAVYAFTRALMLNRRIDATVFQQTKDLLGVTGVVDLVGIIGYYSYIAMTIISFEVDTPGGDPFADLG